MNLRDRLARNLMRRFLRFGAIVIGFVDHFLGNDDAGNRSPLPPPLKLVRRKPGSLSEPFSGRYARKSERQWYSRKVGGPRSELVRRQPERWQLVVEPGRLSDFPWPPLPLPRSLCNLRGWFAPVR